MSNQSEVRTSDKARMFMNTIELNTEFMAADVANGIGKKVYDLGSLFSVLSKKDYIKRVRKVVNPKGGVYAVYIRLKEIPVFLYAGGASLTAQQVVIDYITTLDKPFTIPMLVQRLNVAKSTASYAIKAMVKTEEIIRTGEVTKTGAAYYMRIPKSHATGLIDSFIFGGNPETVRENLYYA